MEDMRFERDGVTLLCGDSMEMLKTLPDDSVHMVCTSPPYYQLRRYLFDKAVVIRSDLNDVDKQFVMMELEKRGIHQRQ